MATRTEPCPTHVAVVDGPIDHAALTAAAIRADCGAVVTFLGTVRDHTDGRNVRDLHFGAYRPMALRRLEELARRAARRWPLRHAAVVHRVGTLGLCDVAVAVVVASGHRADAFAACQWLMDEIKRDVPIWKRETYADGRSREWIHP